MNSETGAAAGGDSPPVKHSAASLQAQMQGMRAKQQAQQLELQRLRQDLLMLRLRGDSGMQAAGGLLFRGQGQDFPNRPFGATGVRMEPPSVPESGTAGRDTSQWAAPPVWDKTPEWASDQSDSFTGLPLGDLGLLGLGGYPWQQPSGFRNGP
jgi:hypothetical protein